jgi:glycosyltransferase involved in cell wall biosynthesis
MRCTVVIPTYNRQESLCRTLNALARQTLSNAEFEVVVVSDGSTDATDVVLAEFATSRRLILRWFTQENSGPAVARNLGMKLARGEVVVFIDDDVEPIPEFLERHLAHHALDDKVVVIGPLSPDPRWTGQEPAWIAWEHAKLQGIYKMFKPGGRYAGCDAGYEHFYSGNASVRREWLLEVGGFNTEFKRQEDVELAARLKRFCNVRFAFDFTADGLHHPVRTRASWLELPNAYGMLDAERVRADTLKAKDVDEVLRRRHGVTRLLTLTYVLAPSLVEPVSSMCCSLASGLYVGGMQNWSLALLSAIYNARYAVAYRRSTAKPNGSTSVAIQ